MKTKVLVSVTTIGNDNWRGQIADLKKFAIREFSLFVSGLKPAEREACYGLLEKLGEVIIPLIHARHDMPVKEYEYLRQRFKTKYFNLHSRAEFPPEYDLAAIRQHILIENSGRIILPQEDVIYFGGICLDLMHLESDLLLNKPHYEVIVNMVEKFGIKANHVSVKNPEPHANINGDMTFDSHTLKKLTQFDYLKHSPKKYFGEFLAIELINPISTQLEAKRYIETILRQKLDSREIVL